MSELEIFTAAVTHADPVERSEFLDRACDGNVELRQRIDELLKQHATVDSLLDRPPQEMIAALTDGETTTDGRHQESINVALVALQQFFEPSNRPDSIGKLAHYELLAVLGQGGYGTVFKGLDTKLDRFVAIKVLNPQLAMTSPARRRFIREARAAAAVQHQNVVQIFAVEESPIPYLVMEFVSGETLQQRSDRVGPFDPADVVKLGLQIARGLEAAHEKGLIHRDIKPGNILIEDGVEPRAKLSDFGLARAADDASSSQSGVVFGTPMYMSPEQVRGEEVDQRSDLFSFGSMLYLMTAGRPPFRAPNTLAVLKRVVEDTPRSLRDVIPGTPDGLFAVIGRLHSKVRDERYAAIRDVIEDLEQCLTTTPSKLRCGNRESLIGKLRKHAILVVSLVLLVGILTSELAGWTRLLQPKPAATPQPAQVAAAVVTPEPNEPTQQSEVAVVLPEGILITHTRDDDSEGSLRWAVREANLHHGPDVIAFDPRVFKEPKQIELTRGSLLLIDPALTTINGPAAGLTISGAQTHQIFVVGVDGKPQEEGAQVALHDLTLSHGHNNSQRNLGGAILCQSGSKLTLVGCLICDNDIPEFNVGGAGIFNNQSEVTVINCTFTRNKAYEGAALKNYGGTMKIVNCTFAANTCESNGTCVWSGGFSRARTEIYNCLFENSVSNPVNFVSDALEVIGDHNISTDDSVPGTASLLMTSARLGPIGRYSGATETYPLLTGSPAVDAGEKSHLPASYRTDQRGRPRIVHEKIDIGAFEVQ